MCSPPLNNCLALVMSEISDQWSAIKFQISGHDENISRPSHLFNSTRSYSQNAYTKPALMLFELKYILEDSLFSEVMKKYYSKWKFKHTNELRFISVVEDVVQEDMSWFFDPWLHTTHRLDYSIESFKKKYQKEDLWKIDLKIKNKGSRFLPIKVRAFHKNGYGQAGLNEVLAPYLFYTLRSYPKAQIWFQTFLFYCCQQFPMLHLLG